MRYLLRKVFLFFTLVFLFTAWFFYLPYGNKYSQGYFPYQAIQDLTPLIQNEFTQFSPEIETWIKNKLSSLTLEEKVSQMFMFRMQGTQMTPDFEKFLKQNKPGGLIVMGDNVSVSLKNFIEDINKTNDKVPYFIAVDQEGGSVKRLNEDSNPGGRSLARLSFDEYCQNYTNTANLLKSKGINTNFGIVADLGIDNRSFIYPRTFPGSPEEVAKYVRSQIRCSKEVFAVVKHFPGHGRTIDDSHKKVPVINISYSDWQKTDALPFIEAIKEFPDMIMVGHLNFPKIDNAPASLSATQINNIRALGFDGVVITDDMQMLANGGLDPMNSLIKAFKAGNDIVLYVSYPLNPETMIKKIVDLVKSGEIPEKRINQSVERILKLKLRII